METKTNTERKKLFGKFAALYLVSIGILFVIIMYLLPRPQSQALITAASPIKTNSDYQEKEILSNIEAINKAYLRLKELDKQTNAQSGTYDKQAAIDAENGLNNTLDSIARIARSYNTGTSLRLQNFIESYQSTVADRSAMNTYKAAMLTSSSGKEGQQLLIKLQADLQLKNEIIQELNDDITSLSNDLKTTSNTTDKQAVAELKSTIAAQQKRITSLTADLKELDADKNKKATVDNDGEVKKQNAALEQKINQLTADLKILQADCNITRADAHQIISNGKQRKQLLSEALSILNNVAAAGDASVKNKVAEKLNRLNNVASNMHD